MDAPSLSLRAGPRLVECWAPFDGACALASVDWGLFSGAPKVFQRQCVQNLLLAGISIGWETGFLTALFWSRQRF